MVGVGTQRRRGSVGLCPSQLSSRLTRQCYAAFVPPRRLRRRADRKRNADRDTRVLYVRSVTTIAVAAIAAIVALASTRGAFVLLVAYAAVAVSRVISETRRHHA